MKEVEEEQLQYEPRKVKRERSPKGINYSATVKKCERELEKLTTMCSMLKEENANLRARVQDLEDTKSTWRAVFQTLRPQLPEVTH